MDFVLYNSLTRKKEIFIPQKKIQAMSSNLLPYAVQMYVCGPTVYDFSHLGNARAMVAFDVLFRFLKHRYQSVTYVRNITDVDDKICAAATAHHCHFSEIAQKFETEFFKDMDSLRVLHPTYTPRATDFIPQMIAMIVILIIKGFAYEAQGHVLFSVEKDSSYGLLSRKNYEQLLAGARVEVEAYKKHPGDFVLWKPSDDAFPGWESPWGRGRPGWHIECSAMSSYYLGEHFDIHGGGIDLIFPHHENERAQSCSSLGVEESARFWMHNGHLLVDGKKMSKSLGNFCVLRDLLKNAHPEAIRFALISTHYRQPLDWTEDSVSCAKQVLNRWYRVLMKHESSPLWKIDKIERFFGEKDSRQQKFQKISRPFFEAMEDDLNTPLAIQALGKMLQESEEDVDYAWTARYCGNLLGVLYENSQAWLQYGAKVDCNDETIEAKIEERNRARSQKDFATSDRIRNELADQGIILEDSGKTTTWRRC